MIQQEEADKTIKVTEFVTTAELAQMMDVAPTQIISACFSLGMMVTQNQRLDAETLSIVAEEFGFTVEFWRLKYRILLLMCKMLKNS